MADKTITKTIPEPTKLSRLELHYRHDAHTKDASPKPRCLNLFLLRCDLVTRERHHRGRLSLVAALVEMLLPTALHHAKFIDKNEADKRHDAIKKGKNP